MSSDDVRREEAARPRDGSLPQGPGALSLRPDPVPGEARTTSTEDFVIRVGVAISSLPALATRAQVTDLVRSLIRVREGELVQKCRRAIQAERNYQAVLHNRVGSKYGRERRDREIEHAMRLREQTAKEIEL